MVPRVRTGVGSERDIRIPFTATVLVMPPFEQPLDIFLTVSLVRRSRVPACKMLHPRVGVIVRDIRRVPVLSVPDEPVEPVRPARARLHRARGVPDRLVRSLSEREEPFEIRLSLGPVVEQLTL